MIALRSFFFAIWFYGLLILLGICWLPALLLPKSATTAGIRIWASAARWGMRCICGATTEIRGQENIPEGGCIIAMKHQATYDTLIPFLFLEDPCFILKKELMWYPIFGWYAGKAQHIAIDRGGTVKTLKKMVNMAKKRSHEGRQIVIFPEGTRYAPGAATKYHTGIAMIYTELDVPCLPIAVNSGFCWPTKGFTRKPGHIVFDIQPIIPPGHPRKVFMASLQESIEPAAQRLLEEGEKAQAEKLA